MSRPQVVLRAFFYLWFSLFAGLVAQGLVNVILVYSHAGRPASLPWGGAVGAGIAAAIILATLVFGQWEQFGSRVRILKWLPLCVIFTLIGPVLFSFGSL